MKLKKFILIAILVSVCLVLAFFWRYQTLVKEGEDNPHDYPFYHYRFDAEKAFQAIQDGDLPVIWPISEDEASRVVKVSEKEINNIWTDSMLLKLQESVIKQLKITRPMKVYFADYDIECGHINRGAYRASYFSSSYWLENDGFHRFDLKITFHIANETILVDLTEYYPVYTNNTSVLNFDNLDFDYFDIIRIADENGGKEKREAINNNCDIEVFSPGISDKNWSIWFRGAGFTVDIDYRNGDIIHNN